MAASFFFFFLSLIFFSFDFHIPSSLAQQAYVNNKQLDCGNQDNFLYGNLCNGVASSCSSYLTFRSISPQYNTPSSIAYLLNSTPSRIAQANNISDVDVIPTNDMVIVPVNCSCSGNYSQHNASYVLKVQGETYFSVVNNTYQALTTCQALMAQNPYGERNLTAGLDLNVPLRCGCPTAKQVDSGFKYLLTYLVAEGETVASIAEIFGVDEQSVLDANELSSSLIYYFTPLMVPLRKEPTRIQSVVSPPPSPSPSPSPAAAAAAGDSSSSKKWVVVGVTVGAALLLVAVSGFVLCYYRRRHRQKSQPSFSTPTTTTTTDTAKKVSDSGTTETWSLSSEGIRYAIDSLTVYKFADLEISTNFFSEGNRIKGSVYRATFKGDDAAVKIYKGDVSGEINILKRINHTNITRLSGLCVHKGNTYLVYEFAENGSLDDWLHNNNNDTKNQNSSSTLSWRQRVQIAHDIADALNYLHNYTNPPHIHKNLKSGNVLLDGNFRAKISNFGLARVLNKNDDDGEEGEGFQVTRHVIGTQGYMPPEYIENGVISPKMDVFAFGVVMLELISGKEAIVGEEKLLSACGREVVEGDEVKKKVGGFVDPALKDEYSLDLAFSMIQIAKRCVERDVNARASISEVFITLSKILSSISAMSDGR